MGLLSPDPELCGGAAHPVQKITSSKHGIAEKYYIIGFYHSLLEEGRGIGGAPPNEMGIWKQVWPNFQL